MKTKTNILKTAIGTLATIVMLIVAIPLMSLSLKKDESHKKEIPTNKSREGKAYWCSYYMAADKRIYMTQVYNNDCNYCQNEIKESFSKWLILYDYDRRASSVHVTSISDVSQSNLEERRTEMIIKRKQQDYTVIDVRYTYTEK